MTAKKKPKKKKSALPDKLSSLLRVALRDLEKAEKSPHYEVDMRTWHTPLYKKDEKICRVCLAGSVLAFSLKAPKDRYYIEIPASRKNIAKLNALDLLRRGKADAALNMMGMYDMKGKLDRNIIHYKRNKREFKDQMKKLAEDLKKEGL